MSKLLCFLGLHVWFSGYDGPEDKHYIWCDKCDKWRVK